MTENTTTEPIDGQTEPVVEVQPEVADAEQDEDTPRKGNPEAAKWRTKLRDAESTNAALTARVAALQASEVTRMATGPGKLHDGSDLLAHNDLADLLDDAGEIDTEKVTAALDSLTKDKPHLAKPVFNGDVGQGQRGQSGSVSWADVIAG